MRPEPVRDPAARPSSRRARRATVDELLTRKEAAERAGVHYNTIRRWERAGKLHPLRMVEGRRTEVRLRASEVDALAAGAPEDAPEPAAAAPPAAAPPARVLGTRRRARPTPLLIVLLASVIAALAAGTLIGRATTPEDRAEAVSAADTAPSGRICLTSWYETGRVTATGERFDPTGLTAASRTLPLGTRVVVTELQQQRSVVVRINDRGPYVGGRCLDLSRRAFSVISPIPKGVIPVRIEVLSGPARAATPPSGG